MNKNLLALAVGAAIALPATALAAGPTLYGQIDLSVENVDVDEDAIGAGSLDTEVGPSSDNTWVMRNNASRIGVRGEAETSVAGLTGFYQAEFGVDADDGGSPFTGRDIYAGLKGDFGAVKLGKFDTPLKKSQGKVDQFNDSTFDISRYTTGETRADNLVQYTSPLLADLVTVNVAVQSEEDGDGSAQSVSVVFDKDGLYLALAFDNKLQSDSDGIEVDGSMAEVDIVRFTAGYAVDDLELGFLYQTAEDGAQYPTDVEDTTLVVSGGLKVGDKVKLKAQYGQTEGDVGGETGSSLAVGADYMLGKSTTLYALAGREELKEAEDDRGVVGVGLRQKF